MAKVDYRQLMSYGSIATSGPNAGYTSYRNASNYTRFTYCGRTDLVVSPGDAITVNMTCRGIDAPQWAMFLFTQSGAAQVATGGAILKSSGHYVDTGWLDNGASYIVPEGTVFAWLNFHDSSNVELTAANLVSFEVESTGDLPKWQDLAGFSAEVGDMLYNGVLLPALPDNSKVIKLLGKELDGRVWLRCVDSLYWNSGETGLGYPSTDYYEFVDGVWDFVSVTTSAGTTYLRNMEGGMPFWSNMDAPAMGDGTILWTASDPVTTASTLLYNGLSLPDISTVWDKSTHPFATIEQSIVGGEVTGEYAVIFSAEKGAVGADGTDYEETLVIGGEWVKYRYNPDLGFTEWTEQTDNVTFDGDAEVITMDLAWANYDVPDGDGTTFLRASDPLDPDAELVKGQIYKYNGVTLGLLPEVTTDYPYLYLVQVPEENAEYTTFKYGLWASTHRAVYDPDKDDVVVPTVSDGYYMTRSYEVAHDDDRFVWGSFTRDGGTDESLTFAGLLNLDVLWSNTDILNSADGSVYFAGTKAVKVGRLHMPSYWAGFVFGMTTPEFKASSGPVYGVEWDYTNTATKLTRTDGAAAFADPTPATTLAEEGSSPFDGLMPWAGMKKYNVIDDKIAYSEDDADFSMTDYDTVVYIPSFYYKVEKDTANGTMKWQISPGAQEGFSKHPGSGRYIGRYHTANNNSVYSSRSGLSPVVSITRATARDNSHAKGDAWWMLDLATWSALQILYLVEYADWDSQTVLGTGQTSGSVKSSGGTDGAAYHTLKRSSASNQYRWVEDPWSNVRDWVDGFVASSRACYVGTDNSTFGDTTIGLTATGITLPSSGFISALGLSDEASWTFLPSAAAGADGSYVSDYVWSSSDVRALFVGGFYNADAHGGLFTLNAYNDASASGTVVGSRLLYAP